MWLSLYLGDESYAIDEYEIYTECESWYKKLSEKIEEVKKVISVVELYSDLITCLVLISMFRKYNWKCCVFW